MNSLLLLALDHAHPNQFQFLQQSPAESPRNAFNKIHQELTRNLTQPVNNHTPVRNGYNKKRQDGIDELITTEMQYIEDLSVVKRVFEMPLKTSSILNQKELENIFVNLDDILHCNQIFLEDLLEKLEFDDDMIGDVILKNVCNSHHFCMILRIYCISVTKYGAVRTLLQKAIRQRFILAETVRGFDTFSRYIA